jgi:hypothetical protein
MGLQVYRSPTKTVLSNKSEKEIIMAKKMKKADKKAAAKKGK